MIARPGAGLPLVRPLKPRDLDRIMAIELAAYPVPWTRGIFEDCLRVGYDCWGLQVEGYLVGYSVQSGAAGEAHLLNLCVDPAWQRRGFGDLLLDNVLRIARGSHCRSVFLEVRPSNTAAIALYERRGFREIGRRPGYYSSRSADAVEGASAAHEHREDALVMELEL